MSPFKATYDRPEVKKAIYDNVNDAIAGRRSPEDAMKRAPAQIDKALSTF